jgi:nucleoside-diphosphate-sugar epimerase
MHSLADTSAAIADLGHTPSNTFESGLRKTLEWYRTSS